MRARAPASTDIAAWQRRLCVWLAALMLFAGAAPGISRMLHAGLFSFSSPSLDYCSTSDRTHVASEHHSGASGHDDDIHCLFCLLFQHSPVLLPALAAAVGPAADAVIGAADFSVAFAIADSARRWLMRRKHGPPIL